MTPWEEAPRTPCTWAGGRFGPGETSPHLPPRPAQHRTTLQRSAHRNSSSTSPELATLFFGRDIQSNRGLTQKLEGREFWSKQCLCPGGRGGAEPGLPGSQLPTLPAKAVGCLQFLVPLSKGLLAPIQQQKRKPDRQARSHCSGSDPRCAVPAQLRRLEKLSLSFPFHVSPA